MVRLTGESRNAQNRPLRSAKLLLSLLAIIFIGIISLVFVGDRFCEHGVLRFMLEESALTDYQTVNSLLGWYQRRKGLFGWEIDGLRGRKKSFPPAEAKEEPGLIKLPPCTVAMEILRKKELEDSKGTRYRFTSPQPLNLKHITNMAEQKAIKKFEQGRLYVVNNIPDKNSSGTLQVIFPIPAQPSCFSCHASVSEQAKFLGTFSVIYNKDKWKQAIPSFTRQTLIISLMLLLAMTIVLYLFSRKTYATKVTVKTQTSYTTVDLLTGLLNRTALFEFIEREVMRANRLGDKLCLVLIDIDHFREINDRYGSRMGDAVLVATSRILESQVREYDIIGRSGGNEFLLLLPQTPLQIAEEICKRLTRMVEKNPVNYGSQVAPVTISTGLVEYSSDETVDTFLSRARGALSNAKANGGNRIETDDVFRIKR